MAQQNLSESRDRVLYMTRAGLSPRQIAKALDVTTQAVYKHLVALRAAGDLPPKEGAA